jgi:hypothetical protein
VSSILQPVDPDARRLRRQRKRQQIRRRRLIAAAVLLGLIGAGILGAVIAARVGGHAAPQRAAAPAAKPIVREPRPYPPEVRGVHISMALAGDPQRLADYIAMKRDGLNTLEIDVKDEQGQIAFDPGFPLARTVGAAYHYYHPSRLAATVHAAGLYLIGRVVTFEDPFLSAGDPELAVRRADGSRWLSNGGLGWTNPYDRRVWRYNVAVAAAAANAGFDEIQFDYVRFPSDGDLSQIRYPGVHPQPMGWTVPLFLKYAAEHLHPLGVRISADVFGLAATRNLGIGQIPRRISRQVDSLYPMVYPSHYGSGEYGIVDPNSRPGVTVAYSLRDFRSQLAGRKTYLIPWLQDFALGRPYTLSDVQDEIESARLEHVNGFLLWNAEGVYTPHALATPSFR